MLNGPIPDDVKFLLEWNHRPRASLYLSVDPYPPIADRERELEDMLLREIANESIIDIYPLLVRVVFSSEGYHNETVPGLHLPCSWFWHRPAPDQ